MAARRRRHGGHEEEHENHERWLVTYADMLTLLMVLFIVMFAISQVDQKKFAALSGGLARSFGAPVAALDTAGPTILDNSSTLPGSVDLATDIAAVAKVDREQVDAAKARAEMEAAAAREAQAKTVVNDLRQAQAVIESELRKKGMSEAVRFGIDKKGLTITVVADQVIFAPDSATLQSGGRRVLDAIGPALRRLKNDIAIEGHTNTVPVKPKNFPSEWELSTARAVTVLRYATDRHQVPAARLSATGYADQRPLYKERSAKADRLHKRVELIVLSGLSSEVAALLPEVAAKTPAAKTPTAKTPTAPAESHADDHH